MLFGSNKVEIRIGTYRDHQMATLIAKRLHKYANGKSNTEHNKLGLRFVTSNSDGKTVLYIASTKLRALDTRTVFTYNQLAKVYEEILKPFFVR